MNKIILDSSAVIEYLRGTEKGKKVQDLLEKPATAAALTGLTATEVFVKSLREAQAVAQVQLALQSLAAVLPFDLLLAESSAQVYLDQRKRKPKFGLADAHVVAAARLHGAKVLTCDNDFAGVPEAVVLR